MIFVGEPLSEDQEVGPALDTATRLARETMRICRVVAWEVDANLRPEGRDGELVRTVASHEAYYRRWAATWEFQALLKARPAAGDAELGQRYVEAITPLVWQAAERPDFVTDVRAMRRRVVAHIPADAADRELKLGAGGLRDVEFAVQLLQLVHGRGDDALRVRGTLPALRVLRDGGYVGRDDAVSLADAYVFLRANEHRLQLHRLKRTHLLPDTDRDRAWLARAMGFQARPARGRPHRLGGRAGPAPARGPPAAREAVLPAIAGGGGPRPGRRTAPVGRRGGPAAGRSGLHRTGRRIAAHRRTDRRLVAPGRPAAHPAPGHPERSGRCARSRRRAVGLPAGVGRVGSQFLVPAYLARRGPRRLAPGLRPGDQPLRVAHAHPRADRAGNAGRRRRAAPAPARGAQRHDERGRPSSQRPGGGGPRHPGGAPHRAVAHRVRRPAGTAGRGRGRHRPERRHRCHAVGRPGRRPGRHRGPHRRPAPIPVRGDRRGPAGGRGGRVRLGRRRHVRLRRGRGRPGGLRRRQVGRRGGGPAAVPAGRAVGGRPAAGYRCRPAAGGPQRSTDPQPGLVRQVLRPLVGPVGGPGAVAGPFRAPGTPSWASASSLSSILSATRPAVCPRLTAARSGASRPGSTPSASPRAPTRRPTPSWDAAGWPISSGPYNCCSSPTGPRSPACGPRAPPRLWSRRPMPD